MKRNDLARMACARAACARVACQAAFLAIGLSISLGSQSARADDSAKPENSKPADTTTPIGLVHQPNLIYRHVDGKALMLDVVRPQLGMGPFPTVILLHGSGPANRGKEGMAHYAEEFARKGYVGVAVSYRCKPEDAFPAPIQDVRHALDWLRAHADQNKIDKDRIGVVGFSGGGALACLLGMKGGSVEDKQKAAENSGRVQAVVSFYGPTDFARLHEVCQAKTKGKECSLGERVQSTYIMQTLEKWLGGPPSKVPERYALASPMTQSEKDSPPMLLIQGADDSVVPPEQSRLFAQRLQKSGRPVSLLIVEGAGHDFEEKNRTHGRLVFAAALAFLDEQLRGPVK